MSRNLPPCPVSSLARSAHTHTHTHMDRQTVKGEHLSSTFMAPHAGHIPAAPDLL